MIPNPLRWFLLFVGVLATLVFSWALFTGPPAPDQSFEGLYWTTDKQWLPVHVDAGGSARYYLGAVSYVRIDSVGDSVDVQEYTGPRATLQIMSVVHDNCNQGYPRENMTSGQLETVINGVTYYCPILITEFAHAVPGRPYGIYPHYVDVGIRVWGDEERTLDKGTIPAGTVVLVMDSPARGWLHVKVNGEDLWTSEYNYLVPER